MYITVLSIIGLLAGVQAKNYGNFAFCKDVTFDTEFQFSAFPLTLYLDSISEPGFIQGLDGVVTKITQGDEEDIYLINADVYTADGNQRTVQLKNILVKKGLAEEHYVNDLGETYTSYAVILGEVSECGAIVIYKCTLDQSETGGDVIEVLRKEKTTLTDACKAKVDAVIEGKGVTVTPLVTLPYKTVP